MLSLERIAQRLELTLNRPFSKDLTTTVMDNYQADNLYELAKIAVPEHLDAFKAEVGDAVSEMFSNEFTPKLRVSTLGKEPILQALSHLGYGDKGMDNFYLALQGHILEAVTRLILRCRGFYIEYGEGFYTNEVDFMVVKGHPDFILKTPQGRRIVCEVKCVSGNFLDGFLEPERVESPDTGNLVKSGQRLSRLNQFAESNDYRGYIEQLSVYAHCHKLEALWVIWDKDSHQYRVVALPELTRNAAIKRVAELIPQLTSCKTLEDVFNKFEIPKPNAQKARGVETGLYYVPFTLRNSNFKYIFYPDVITLFQRGKYIEFVRKGRVSTPQEAIELFQENISAA